MNNGSGLVGTAFAMVARIVLYLLVAIQYTYLLIAAKRISDQHSVQIGVYELLLVYLVPLLFGELLRRSLKQAMNAGELSAKWGNVCNNWVSSLLLIAYVVLPHSRNLQ